MSDLEKLDRRTVLGLIAGTGAGVGGVKAFASPGSRRPAAAGPQVQMGGCDQLSDPKHPVWVTEKATHVQATTGLARGGGLEPVRVPVRVSYTQQVSYLGTTWDEQETQWEHEFSVTTLGLSTVWRQTIFGGEVCPPVGVDPLEAECVPSSFSDESNPNPRLDALGPNPDPRFTEAQSLEVALDDSDSPAQSGTGFGSIQVDYQSNELLFWDHTPFLKDGIDPRLSEVDQSFREGIPQDAGLNDRYNRPEIVRNQWEDDWRQAVDSIFVEDLINQRAELLHELEDRPVNPDDLPMAAAGLGLTFAPYAGISPSSKAEVALELAPIIGDVLTSGAEQPTRNPPPNEGFFDRVTLDFPVPIVGHHSAFKVASPPRDPPERSTVTIESKVSIDSSDSEKLSSELGTGLAHLTDVSLVSPPEPGPREGLDWIFEDNMFRSDEADRNSTGELIAELSGVRPVITPPVEPVTVADELVFEGARTGPGGAELDAYAWLWVMEQPGETPQMGRVCSTDVSTIENLVIPPEDFEKPGTLTVWLLARDRTGLWNRAKATVDVADSSPTPTPTPDSLAGSPITHFAIWSTGSTEGSPGVWQFDDVTHAENGVVEDFSGGLGAWRTHLTGNTTWTTTSGKGEFEWDSGSAESDVARLPVSTTFAAGPYAFTTSRLSDPGDDINVGWYTDHHADWRDWNATGSNGRVNAGISFNLRRETTDTIWVETNRERIDTGVASAGDYRLVIDDLDFSGVPQTGTYRIEDLGGTTLDSGSFEFDWPTLT